MAERQPAAANTTRYAARLNLDTAGAYGPESPGYPKGDRHATGTGTAAPPNTYNLPRPGAAWSGIKGPSMKPHVKMIAPILGDGDPEDKLWMAFFVRTIEDLYIERYRPRVIAWIKSDTQGAGSFRFICLWFNLNSTAVRRLLLDRATRAENEPQQKSGLHALFPGRLNRFTSARAVDDA